MDKPITMLNIEDSVKFGADGLVPAITQDCRTDEVLMLAYMNRESLQKTLETGTAHYYSRSRQKLWHKGETSGHYQLLRSIAVDCDGDTLLMKVEQTGAACHTGHHSCFFRKIDMQKCGETPKEQQDTAIFSKHEHKAEQVTQELSEAGPEVLENVFNVIKDRMQNPREGSYTNYLISKGLDKILKKIGEEASEVIIAAKNQNVSEIKGETADLLYHLMVMLAERGMSTSDIYEELRKRE